MAFRQVASHEFLAKLEVEEAQLGENANCLFISGFKKAEFGAKGVGGSRKAASFGRRKRNSFLEKIVNFFHGNVAIVQTRCQNLQPIIYHLVRAIE